jgi:hypothetical protein
VEPLVWLRLMELPPRTQPQPTLWAQAPMWLRRVELLPRARQPNSLWVPPPVA